ncbi:DUF4215 domain-containing protein [Leptospira meyeri]|uniref:DUF4215 domain-containing protein n=1 Tax=Leptospira meyeri TaxID=29508 RepID=UPI00223D0DF0|nr:DUF4215 domain-containing protein [Leptospira meyeri]MCW7488825.1 DUF4215 domain-containing protein [Leptospira meyeri]
MKKRRNLLFKLGIGGLLISGIITACAMAKKNENGNVGILALLAAATSTIGPITPTLKAEGGNFQITLSWDTNAGAESYNLYHSTATGVTIQSGTKIASVNSPFVHTGQANAVSRSYILTAVRGGQEGPASNVQTAMAGQCGNGDIQTYAGEACDDGNTTDDNNGCSTTCKRVGFCGDSIRQNLFEACEVGGVNSPACDSDCTAPVCGDGIRNAPNGEVCDDGNVANGDGCNSTCSGP